MGLVGEAFKIIAFKEIPQIAPTPAGQACRSVLPTPWATYGELFILDVPTGSTTASLRRSLLNYRHSWPPESHAHVSHWYNDKEKKIPYYVTMANTWKHPFVLEKGDWQGREFEKWHTSLFHWFKTGCPNICITWGKSQKKSSNLECIFIIQYKHLLGNNLNIYLKIM